MWVDDNGNIEHLLLHLHAHKTHNEQNKHMKKKNERNLERKFLNDRERTDDNNQTKI